MTKHAASNATYTEYTCTRHLQGEYTHRACTGHSTYGDCDVKRQGTGRHRAETYFPVAADRAPYAHTGFELGAL